MFLTGKFVRSLEVVSEGLELVPERLREAFRVLRKSPENPDGFFTITLRIFQRTNSLPRGS